MESLSGNRIAEYFIIFPNNSGLISFFFFEEEELGQISNLRGHSPNLVVF